MKKTQKNLFDIIEGFYLAQILMFLNDAGYFTHKKNITHSIPEAELLPLLQVLAERTDIIKKKRSGGFTVADEYAHYPLLGFHIEKLLQAYGNVAPAKNKFRLQIDGKKFAGAYKKVYPFQDWQFLLDMIEGWPVNHLLDLGCGMGKLAVQFGKQDKKHTAVGIDAAKEMCSAARSFIREAKLSTRAKIVCAKAEAFHRVLPPAVMERTDIIVASNLLNEFFSGEGEAVISLLKQLKKSFPGRPLMVVDYYGILGTSRNSDPGLRHNYVHDMVQLFSGQGVPPAHYRQWQKLYRRAGCMLEAVTEGRSQGVNWFVHQVRL